MYLTEVAVRVPNMNGMTSDNKRGVYILNTSSDINDRNKENEKQRP